MIIEFLLLFLITGLFYMILPVLFVKLRGKKTSGKAFLLSLLNWLLIHIIFISIYNMVYPGEIDSIVYSGPILWLYISWRYMNVNSSKLGFWAYIVLKYKTFKDGAKNTAPQTSTPNSIGDLQRKFNLDLADSPYESFTRETTKYVLFNFKSGKTNHQNDKFKYLVVANVTDNGYRYFAVESSFTGTEMLCEWKFDEKNKEVAHLNYGGVAESKFDLLAEKVIIGNEVLIDQIHSIIVMKVEPEVTSTRSETGWSSTTKKVDEAYEENMKRILEELKTKNS